MTSRPILFSGPMVRAILAGTKTQTRRGVKWKPLNPGLNVTFSGLDVDRFMRIGGPVWMLTGRNGDGAWEDRSEPILCPYGVPGDRLWVRETWQYDRHALSAMRDEDGPFVYAADSAEQQRIEPKWRPSIFMPRWASRITLEVTAVCVMRLQNINDQDAIAEGCDRNHNGYFWGGPHAEGGRKQLATARAAYRDLWESINGPGSWDSNPWVWVVEFKRVPQ